MASLETADARDLAQPNKDAPAHRYPPCPIPEYVLKVPARQTVVVAEEPTGPPGPHESAVSLEFLRILLRRLPGGGGATASPPVTVAKLVDEVLKPSTGMAQASYASQPNLVPRGHTSTPTYVVIHPWDMPYENLLSALEQHLAGLPPASTFLWLSALATSHHLPRATNPAQILLNMAAASATGILPSLEERQAALAAAHAAAVRQQRDGVLAATRAAMAAARCGALVVVGREVRPWRRAWCLVEAAEVLRLHGPEALNLVTADKGFRRADLVRQLRELDVEAAVAAAEPYDREMLAEALGVPPPAPPPPPGAGRGSRRTLAKTGSGVGSFRGTARAGLAAEGSGRLGREGSGSLGAIGGKGAEGDGGAAAILDCAPGAAGRALARQLQLALLLRPMDGTTHARALGASIQPLPHPTAAPAPPPAAPSEPWAFPWLWNWAPFNSWLALPSSHPQHKAFLLSGAPASGKSTALAALVATHGRAVSACHFCTAADVRSFAPGEIVRSIAYQLAVHTPTASTGVAAGGVGGGSLPGQAAGGSTTVSYGGFGAALCRPLLELGGSGLVPDPWLQGTDEVVGALLRRPLEQVAAVRQERGLPPASHVVVIDGLEEEAAAWALGGSRGVASGASEQYEALRLVVDHLQHLPGVRLVLSCTAAPAPEEEQQATGPAQGQRKQQEQPPWAASSAARSSTPTRGRPPATHSGPGSAPLFNTPYPVLPGEGADGGAGVGWDRAARGVVAALRQALRPVEVPLSLLRRDELLPLALAHVLQAYVLSPELTARELLWQARGCLMHANLLALLVAHAAEQLGPMLVPPQPPPPLPPANTDPLLKAAAAGAGPTANGGESDMKVETTNGVPPSAAAVAAAAAAAAGEALAVAAEAAAEAAAKAAALGHTDAGKGDGGGDALPPQPSTPTPRQASPARGGTVQAGLRSGVGVSIRVGVDDGAGGASGVGYSLNSPAASPRKGMAHSLSVTLDPGAQAWADGSVPLSPARLQPVASQVFEVDEVAAAEAAVAAKAAAKAQLAADEAAAAAHAARTAAELEAAEAALRAAGSGSGPHAVHAVPTVCRGSLQDEYETLWSVRTGQLQHAVAVALLAATAAAATRPSFTSVPPVAPSAAAGPPSPSSPKHDVAASGGHVSGPSAVGGGSGNDAAGGKPRRTMLSRALSFGRRSMTPHAPKPAPMHPPDRAVRLQLVTDVLAAAREPLEWVALARVVQTVNATTVKRAGKADRCRSSCGGASVGGREPVGSRGVSGTGEGFAGLRTYTFWGRSSSGVGSEGQGMESSRDGGGVDGPVGSRRVAARESSVLGAVEEGREGEEGEQATPAGNDGRDALSGSIEGEWLSEDGSPNESDDDDSVTSPLPCAGEGYDQPQAMAAVIDLDWALREGPLAGLVWLRGDGRVRVRHASFLQWLRSGGGGGGGGGDAAGGGASIIGGGGKLRDEAAAMAAAVTAAGAMQVPRPKVGHEVLAAAALRELSEEWRNDSTASSAAAGKASAPSTRQGTPATATTRSGSMAVVAAAAAAAASTAAALSENPYGGHGHGLSGYCLRQVFVHVVEGGRAGSDLEGIVTDLTYWRHVLEGGHVAIVAASLEHLLRTRGPHACPGPALLSSSPPARVPHLVSATALTTRTNPSTSVTLSGGIADTSAAQRPISPVLRLREQHAGPPSARTLPAATAELLQSVLQWLRADGTTLSLRPEPLVIACSASATPLYGPLRVKVEQLTAAGVAAAAAAAALHASRASGTGDGSVAASRGGTPLNGARPALGAAASSHRASSGLSAADTAAAAVPGAGAVTSPSGMASPRRMRESASISGSGLPLPLPPPQPPAEPPYPPAPVTALPHPRGWPCALPPVACAHAATRLVTSPDGGTLLATAEWAMQVSLIDTHTCRVSVHLDAGPSAHSSALSSPAFSPDGRLLATAGSEPGTLALWDVHTGVRCSQLCLNPQPAAGPADGQSGAQQGEDKALLLHQHRHLSNSGVPAWMLHSLDTASVVTAVRFCVPAPGVCAQCDPEAPLVAHANSSTSGNGPNCSSGDSRAGGRGKLLMAVGESGCGRVVLWAVEPDGSSAARVGELLPPGPSSTASHGGAPIGSGLGPGSSAGVCWLEFGPGGRQLVVVQSCSTVVRVWGVQGRHVVATLRLPASCGEVLAVRFSPHHRPASPPHPTAPPPVTRTASSTTPVPSPRPTAGTTNANTPGGSDTLLAIVTTTSTQLWSVERRQLVAALPAAARTRGVAWAEACVAFSPAGGLLATATAVMAAPSLRSTSSLLPAASGTLGSPVPNGDAGGSGRPSISGNAIAAELRRQSTVWTRGVAAAPELSAEESAALTEALGAAAAVAVGEVDERAATLWDARTGAAVATLRPLYGRCTAVAFSPDGALLATAAGDTVVLWSAAAAARLVVLPVKHPDHGAGAGGGGSGTGMLSVGGGGEEVTAEVTSLSFGRGGALLAAATPNGVQAWDVPAALAAAAKAAALSFHNGAGRSMKSTTSTRLSMTSNFNPQRSITSTYGNEGDLLFMRRTGMGGGDVPAGLDTAAALAAAAAGGVVGHTERVSAMALHPNGMMAVTGSFDCTVRVWDLRHHTQAAQLELASGIWSLSWSPDAAHIAVGLNHGAVVVLHAQSALAATTGRGEITQAAQMHCTDGSLPVCSVAFSYDSTTLSTVDGVGVVVLWSTKGWAKLTTVAPAARSPMGGVGAMARYGGQAWTPDGAWLVLGSGREVRAWSTEAQADAEEVLGPLPGLVAAVAVSPNALFVAVAVGSSVVVYGRAPGGGAGAAAAGHRGSHGARRGKRESGLVGGAAGEGGARRSSGMDGGGEGRRASRSMSPLPAEPPTLPYEPRVATLYSTAEVTAVAFSHDSVLLAGCMSDGSVRVWETKRWKELAWLQGHVGGAECVAFSPDTRVLLSGGWDGRCLAWSMRDVLPPKATWV